nr:hypothetical protein [Tanacetum cinerariifolium]
SSSDDDSLYYENIEYVEASPHDSEFVNLEVEKIVIPEDEEIEDDNLHEKLLKISSGSTTNHSDISLLEYEAFSFYDDHIEEIRSGSPTTESDISLPEYDSFIFNLSNDQFPSTDRSALLMRGSAMNPVTSYLHQSMIVSTLGICPIREIFDLCGRGSSCGLCRSLNEVKDLETIEIVLKQFTPVGVIQFAHIKMNGKLDGAYAPLMPSLSSLPLSIAYDDQKAASQWPTECNRRKLAGAALSTELYAYGI